MDLLALLGSQSGRLLRVAAGGALIIAGMFQRGWWLALVPIGLVPLAAGVFDRCVLGPIFGLPFVGPRFRQARMSR